MANTSIEEIESEKCPRCNETMTLQICGAQGLWICFKCKEFKKEYNFLGRLLDKVLG